MGRRERLKEALAEVQKEAIGRYVERASEREDTRRKIFAGGPGAADSILRQNNYLKRITALDQIRAKAAITGLPVGFERKLGTLDFTPNPGEAAIKAGRPVARIIELVDEGNEPEGFATGFLVAPDLLMTNWHVFETRADAKGCGANFNYERTERGIQRGIIFEFRPDNFFVSDKALDFAIVAVEPRSTSNDILSDLGQISLSEARPKILKGQPINIIQHPEGGPKEYAISQNLLIDILEAEGFLQYETDTLEGSSGSPAFSKDWELVALHHASIPQLINGRPVDKQGNPWTPEMNDDDVNWIANEGARASAIVDRLSKIQAVTETEQSILRHLVESASDPVAEASAQMAANVDLISAEARRLIPNTPTQIQLGEQAMSGIQLTFTGPVTINVGTASPAQIPVPATPEVQPYVGIEKAIRFDPDYDERPGYNEEFLENGIVVPTPDVAPDRLHEIYKGEDGLPLVLAYHHFELVMNKARRLQMWSAVNVDYAPNRKSDKDRDAWGSDKWIADPRIPANIQIFDADFYKPAGNIDRGHIVRREDNEWGDDLSEIEYANSDTFHWTNCTPQHEAFNQSVPGRNDKTYKGMEGIWGAFENYVQQSRKGNDTRACILAGPVLASNDPSADFGKGTIQYPLAFWKVICVAENIDGETKLQAFGFWLTQDDVVKKFGIETFRAGRFKRYQRTIADIGRDAGIIFDQTILDADTFEADLEAIS